MKTTDLFKKTLTMLSVAMTILSTSCGENMEEIPKNNGKGGDNWQDEIDYEARAKEIYDRTVNRYRIQGGTYNGMFYESVPRQTNDPQCSFVWSYDWLMAGITLIHKLGYEVGYETLCENYEKYWMESSSVQNIGGYGPGTSGIDKSGNGDRYYDDNSIVGTNLVDAYKLTGKQHYLDRAKQVVAFLRTAKDNHLGGGLWWREPNRNSSSNLREDLKPSCANGSAMCFLVEYYSICPAEEKASVLSFAKEIYDWMYTHLRNEQDLYINAILANGTKELSLDPGNAGIALQTGIRLYEITGERKYLDHAIATADACYDYFVKTRNGVLLYPAEEPWSTTVLFRAFRRLLPHYPGVKTYIERYIYHMDYAYQNSRNSDGFFWEYVGSGEGRSHLLLTQNSALESYAAIALYKRDQENN